MANIQLEIYNGLSIVHFLGCGIYFDFSQWQLVKQTKLYISATPHKDNSDKTPQPPNVDEEMDNCENSDDESDTSVHCNIIPPRLQPIPNTIRPENCKQDNLIKLLKPGIQVCAFEYNILPPIGVYYRVNKNHHLVKVVIEPGIIYQADNECNLYKVGLPYANNSND